MTNRKSVKRALVASIMAIMLCAVMLVGTTFAWFTDTASSGLNKIVSGNLDVELESSTDMVNWEKVTADTKLFKDDTLWEPGHTEVVYLKVVNVGKLALKYEVNTNSYDLERGKNADGKFFYIDKYLKIGLAETGTAFTDRSAALAAIADNEQTLSKELQISKDWTVLEAGAESNPFAVVLHMPTTVGNEANNVQSWRKPSVKGLGLIVNATQATVESDGYGKDYDEKAPTRITTTSSSSEKLEVNENIRASGRYGAVQAEKTAQYTINADVYAVYAKDNNGLGGAVAVWASGTSKVVINGGDFRQVDVPADDPVCDLIYADTNATIEINGGTFKAVDPTRTLNCKDGSSAKITVNGGSFYQYDPSNHTLGAGEVVIGEGHTVEKVGDWYIVK